MDKEETILVLLVIGLVLWSQSAKASAKVTAPPPPTGGPSLSDVTAAGALVVRIVSSLTGGASNTGVAGESYGLPEDEGFVPAP